MNIAINKINIGFLSFWSSDLYKFLIEDCDWPTYKCVPKNYLYEKHKNPYILTHKKYNSIVLNEFLTENILRTNMDVIHGIFILGKESAVYGNEFGIADVPCDIEWEISTCNDLGINRESIIKKIDKRWFKV